MVWWDMITSVVSTRCIDPQADLFHPITMMNEGQGFTDLPCRGGGGVGLGVASACVSQSACTVYRIIPNRIYTTVNRMYMTEILKYLLKDAAAGTAGTHISGYCNNQWR